MTFEDKILRWLMFGIDDRIIILELIKTKLDRETYKAAERIIAMQTEKDKEIDLSNKMLRILQKGEAINEKCKSMPDGEDKEMLETIMKSMMHTLNKMIEECKKIDK